MKRFLFYILIFSTPIIFLLIVTEVLIRNIPNEYSQKKGFLDQNSKEIEILVLGSSHTLRGVNPKYFDGKGYNAAMVSQSLDYDLEILKKYDGKWDNLKTIILPISYFSLYFNLENGIESWRVKNYNIYFDIYKENDWKFYTEVFNTPFRDNIKHINNYYLKSDTLNIPISNLGWDYKRAMRKPLKMEESGRLAANRHTIESVDLFNSNIRLLNGILILAKKNNWNVILVTPPAHYSYRRHLEQNQLNSTIETLFKTELHYENVKYYNLIDSPNFGEEDFYDADHLNGNGAVKFSKMLNDYIKNISLN